MKNIRKSKFLSLLLVMCLIVGMTQVTAQADEVINNDEDIPIPEITIVQEPSNITVTQGAITEKLSVTATTSNNAPISYQWADENGEPISGEIGPEFVIPTGLEAGIYYYYCVLSAEGCADKFSIPVRVSVESNPECSHEFGTDLLYDETNHWHQCSCGEKAEVEAHKFGDWIVTSEPTETTVGVRKKECTLCALTISEDIPTNDSKEYNLEDVQKINTLIDNSYLEATKDDPESWSDFASWDDATPKNLIGLDFTSKPNIFLGATEISNFNNLETLNMGTQEAILALYCGNNRLTSLEISQLSSLDTLYCAENQLSSLEVNGLSELTMLDCSGNQLSNLAVSDLPSLTTLNCYNNELNSLDVSDLSNLASLNCDDNKLSSLDVSALPNLTSLMCYNNKLSSLEVGNLLKLNNLYCYNNELSSLNVSGLSGLMDLRCYNNQLSEVNLEGLKNLTKFYGAGNPIATFTNREGKTLSISQEAGTIFMGLPLNEWNYENYGYNVDTNVVTLYASEGTFEKWKFSQDVTFAENTNNKSNPVAFKLLENVNAELAQDSQESILVTDIIISGEDKIETKSGTLQLDAEVKPDNADNKEVTWESSDTNLATVDENGLVTAKANGTVRITATSKDGSGVYADMDIAITNQGKYNPEDVQKINYLIETSDLEATVDTPESWSDFASWDNATPKNLIELDFSEKTDVFSRVVDINNFSKLAALTMGNQPRMTSLVCANSQLSSLDVSGLSNISSLNCSWNVITSLDISGLSNLSYLDCSGNQLQSLDVSGLSNLTSLNCSINQITSLDVSGLSNLTSLNCSINQITSLDVSGLSNLTSLNCSINQITSLDVSGLSYLILLDCSSNQLNSLDVKDLSNLYTLYCEKNELSSLDVSNLSGLGTFWCYNNQLNELDLSSQQNLEEFYGAGNPIINFTNQEGKVLSVSQEGGTIFMGLPNLENQQEAAKGYDINTKIITLYASEEETFEEWGFSKAVTFAENTNEKSNPVSFKLTEDVNARFSQDSQESVLVTDIIISGEDKIEMKNGTLQLEAEVKPDNADNKGIVWSSSDVDIALVDSEGLVTAKTDGVVIITVMALDGSGVTNSKEITITNQVEYNLEDVQKINNLINSSDLEATVDNPESWADFASWDDSTPKNLIGLDFSDQDDVFSNYVVISDFKKLATLTMGNQPKLNSVYCQDNQLSSLNVSGLSNLTHLDCSGNQLNGLDVNALAKLEILYCENNELSSLNVSDLPELTDLWCYNNQLNELDLSSLQNLEEFYGAGNPIINFTNQEGKVLSVSQEGGTIFMGLPNRENQQEAAKGYDINTKIITLYASEEETFKEWGFSKDVTFANNTNKKSNPVSFKLTEDVNAGLSQDSQEAILVTEIIISGGDKIETKNGTLQLEAEVKPDNADNKGVVWSSSDDDIAVVDETGLVTAKADGVVTITATAKDGSGVDAEIDITITNQVTYNPEDVQKINNLIEASNLDATPNNPSNWSDFASWDDATPKNLIGLDFSDQDDVFSGCVNISNFEKLATLTMGNQPNLDELDCLDNQLSRLDVSGLSNINYLDCSGNQLTSLDVNALSKLETLYCENNELSSLNASNVSVLEVFWCYNNQLSELNLNGLQHLWSFNGAGNPIATFTNQEGKTLSVSQEDGTIFMGLPNRENPQEAVKGYDINTKIITLHASEEETFKEWAFSSEVTFEENTNEKSNPVYFKLTEDVNVGLSQDSQESILVTEIIISGGDKIETKNGTLQLEAEVKPDNADNKRVVWSSSDVDIALVDSEGLVTAKTDGVVIITAMALDGSGVTNYKEITTTNQVEYNLEDVQKINNLINSSDLEATVDNPAEWSDFASWDDATPKNLIGLDFSDQDDVFSGCVDISNFEKLATLIMGNQPNLDGLDCLDNQLSRLNVSGLSNLTYLDCSGNQLNSLDVNALAKLETLYCENNELSSLDISGLSGLKIFWCYNNQLSELDLNNLQDLGNFAGAGNPIATFTNQEGKTLSVSQEGGTIFMGLPNRENPLEAAKGYDIDTKIITLYASEGGTFKEWTFSADITFVDDTNEKSNPVSFKLAEDVNAGLLQKEPEEKPVTEITISGADKIETKAGKIQLEAEVKPDDADNKEVTWKSSDSSIATVDANGLVTAKVDGKVNIMATAIDGSNVTGSKEITITNQSEGAEEVQPIIYEVIGDKEGTWTKGSKEGYTIKSSGDVEKFLSVTFNGEKIATEDFTVEAGSTILTLKPEFLEKQSADTHNIRLEYSDGYAQTTLKIAQEAENSTNEKPTNPSESADSDTKGTGGTGTTKTSASANTGDSASTLSYLFLLLIAAFTGTVSYQRKKSRK